MKLELLEDFYIEELRDILDAEKQLLKAMPRMAEAATAPELREGFEMHIRQTEEQLKRLQQIFKRLEEPAKGKKCKAMEGLIEEGKEIMEEGLEPDVLDAALICAAQKVEHYEIATYGTLCTWAGALGYRNAKAALGSNLDEEEKADKKLTKISKSVNKGAKT